MRRKDKEITDRSALEAIIRQAEICYLGLADGDQPYVVPMNFGYQHGSVYVHGALQGRKMEILQNNPKVCVTFSVHCALVTAEKACDWGERFQSVIAFGNAVVLHDTMEKRRGLDTIMAQYSNQPHTYPETKLAATAVIKITLDTVTGKQSGFSSQD